MFATMAIAWLPPVPSASRAANQVAAQIQTQVPIMVAAQDQFVTVAALAKK